MIKMLKLFITLKLWPVPIFLLVLISNLILAFIHIKTNIPKFLTIYMSITKLQ